jgi:hypothetical protein
VPRTDIDAVPKVRNRQHVARAQAAGFYAPTVDTDAICAAQVVNNDLASVNGEGAMVPRQSQRVEPCVTRTVPPHDNHRFAEQNVRTIIKGYKSHLHRKDSLNETAKGNVPATLRRRVHINHRSQSCKWRDRFASIDLSC